MSLAEKIDDLHAGIIFIDHRSNHNSKKESIYYEFTQQKIAHNFQHHSYDVDDIYRSSIG